MGMDPTKILEDTMELKVGNRVYVIPLKDKKQNVSFRAMTEAIRIIDRFCKSNNRGSRSKFLGRLVEIVASLILSARYEVSSITIIVVDKNGKDHKGSIVFIHDNT